LIKINWAGRFRKSRNFPRSRNSKGENMEVVVKRVPRNPIFKESNFEENIESEFAWYRCHSVMELDVRIRIRVREDKE
jgi:hypothetical protein